MLRVSCYLPVHCANGAEFASFAVCFLEFSGRCVHICEIYAVKYVQKVITKDYLTCNPGKCCEFHVICPCIVRMVQNLRHSLYVSWSSLDGLLVCLLWCGFSEFRVIRGSFGRIARNLVDSLHFSWVLWQ